MIRYELSTPPAGEPGSGLVYSLSVMTGRGEYRLTVIPGTTLVELSRSVRGAESDVMAVVKAFVDECGGTEFSPSPAGVKAFRRRASLICFESHLREFDVTDLDLSDAVEAAKRILAVEPVVGS